MRLSELLGRPVADATGSTIGGVADVRLVQDGPLLPSMNSALRIDGLIVVERHTTQLFGYGRHVGPALVRWLDHRYLGEVWYLPWQDITEVGDPIATSLHRADLRALEENARY